MKRSLLFAVTLLATPAALFAQDLDAATAAAVASKSHAMTLFGLLQSGGPAMIPLAIMSVLTVMLIFGYTITLRRGAILSNQFMNTAEVLLKKRDYTGLLAISNRHSEAVARIVHRMLDFVGKNPGASFEVVREIAQTEGATQAASLQNRITYLADIAVLSPMVGLLGTVFGIIQSFGVLANSATSQASRPILLAQGVSEALVATGSGLVIGIISMAFYGLFRNKVQALLSELERATVHLLGLMSIHSEHRETARPQPQEQPRRDFKMEPRRRPDDQIEHLPPPPTPRRPATTVEDEF
ncbi:MAG: MotA/TolQ/ExbB proton channel family protein [Verrucomicrobiota bacterium]